jgi:trehalose 6-phosphate synthase/phosphatase
VNQKFADAISDVYEDGDMIWIQGYHFTLLPQVSYFGLFSCILLSFLLCFIIHEPIHFAVRLGYFLWTQMIRSSIPTSAIGLFFHLPFPSSELYRVLPYREDILEGMLASNLIGFQTFDYNRHFLSTCSRILGLGTTYKGISNPNGHFTNVCICPVGIDPPYYASLVKKAEVQHHIKQLQQQFRGKIVLLGVDKIDYIKGLVHKVIAVEELLDDHQELAEKIVMVQVGISAGSESYNSKLVESQLSAMVGRINAKFRTMANESPVQLITREVSMEELAAFMCVADVCVSTPIRDGMNLLPFGYVVCRETEGLHGTVVLSEFAGAVQSLGGAMLVNPWDTQRFCEVLFNSIKMDPKERERRHRLMHQSICQFTVHNWANNFMEQFREVIDEHDVSFGRELHSRDMMVAYERSKKRLLIFAYEGVLSPQITTFPELAQMSDQVRANLKILASDPQNTVIVISARSGAVMEKWIGDIPVVLAAEYGVYVRWRPQDLWECQVPNLDISWKENVMPLLKYYSDRTPGAVIEIKESAIAWHYRDCDLDHGVWQARELFASLTQLTKQLPIAVVSGEKTVEVLQNSIQSVKALLTTVMEKMVNDGIIPATSEDGTQLNGDSGKGDLPESDNNGSEINGQQDGKSSPFLAST